MEKESNGYSIKTIDISRTKWSIVLAEGLGIGGTYEVFGKISIREQSGRWTAQVVAQANAQANAQSAKGLGNVTFSGEVYLYIDGSQRDKKDLDNCPAKMTSEDTRCNLGTCSFILPPEGKVEIEVKVQYTVKTDTGVAAGLNKLGDMGYSINKTLGKWFGKIREEIN